MYYMPSIIRHKRQLLSCETEVAHFKRSETFRCERGSIMESFSNIDVAKLYVYAFFLCLCKISSLCERVSRMIRLFKNLTYLKEGFTKKFVHFRLFLFIFENFRRGHLIFSISSVLVKQTQRLKINRTFTNPIFVFLIFSVSKRL